MSQGMCQKTAYPCYFSNPCNNCFFPTRIRPPSELCQQITLQQLRQNCYLFHWTKKRWTPRLREWCSKKLLAGWLVSKQTVDTWEKLEDFVHYVRTPWQTAQIWLFCTQQASDFSLPTCFQNKRGVANTYTHCQRSGKALKLSWEQCIKCLYTPSFIKNKNSLCCACVIHQQASLVVYLRNKLARTRKLPELPSQKSPAFPDGGLVYWTGKGKKQAKHNCALFTHICSSFSWCTYTCTHNNTHWKLLSAYTQHMQWANPLHF